MKPVAIFRFTETEGPGYFATFLEQRSIPSQLIAIDRGERAPANTADFSGICLMGGPMSVNDHLPWIEEICQLVRDADAKAVPVIGHCLGGQLMSKAFGGRVTGNPVKEIGWSSARVETSEASRDWLGDAEQTTVFQWHGETFTLPSGALRLLTNDSCANQMYVLGLHLAMQFHIEMTPEMIAEWCKSWPVEVQGLASLPTSVQTPVRMLADTPSHLPALRLLADRIYARWITGLA